MNTLRREVESKRTWSEFWENQANSRAFIPRLIRWLRSYFSRAYADFVKRHCLGVSMLEAGCGSAESTFRLVSQTEAIKKVTLLDFSPQSMVLAKKNARTHRVDADFVVGDIHFMPFKPGSFNFVWNIGVLEHFEDFTPVIKEMKRVTQNKGRIVAIVPFKYFPLQYVSALNYVKFQTWKETERLWSPKQLQQRFEHVGLKRVKVHLMFRSFLVNVAVVGEKTGE